MRSRTNRFAWLVALLAIFSLVAAACSDDDDGGDSGSDDTSEAATAAGHREVIVSGSSTVEPISVAGGRGVRRRGSAIAVDVDGPGTGDGFELFCAGETDISDASRPINEEEVAACEDAGIEFIELEVGIDGLSVLTNPANDDVECLSFADLYALIGPESEGFDNWSDAAAARRRARARPPSSPTPRSTSPPPARSRAPTTASSSSRSSRIAEARLEAGDDRPRTQAETTGPTTPRQADDNADHPGHRGQRQLASAGSASPSPRARATRQGARDRRRPTAASRRRPRRSPTAATRVPAALHLRERGEGRGERGHRRATSTSTSATASRAVEEAGYVALPDDQLADTVSLGGPHHRQQRRLTGLGRAGWSGTPAQSPDQRSERSHRPSR